jgi:hypothetical protein
MFACHNIVPRRLGRVGLSKLLALWLLKVTKIAQVTLHSCSIWFVLVLYQRELWKNSNATFVKDVRMSRGIYVSLWDRVSSPQTLATDKPLEHSKGLARVGLRYHMPCPFDCCVSQAFVFNAVTSNLTVQQEKVRSTWKWHAFCRPSFSRVPLLLII